MSRIPKFESKLRKPGTLDDVGELPVFQNKKKNVLRRSRSYETLVTGPPASKQPLLSSLRKPLVNSNLKAAPRVRTQLQFNSKETEDKLSELPAFKNLPKSRNIRRSKSFSDLKNTQLSTKKVKPLPSAVSKAIANKQTTSNVKVPKTVSSTTRANITKPIAGVKRPGGTCDAEVKSKVVKKAKVPDWDYKTRFTLLQEKYNTLQNDYKLHTKSTEEVRAEILGLQETQELLKVENETLTTKNNEITQYKNELETKYGQTCTELNHSKKTFDILQNKYDKLLSEKEEIAGCLRDLETKFKQTCKEFNELKERSKTLQSDYELCSAEKQQLSEEKEHLLNKIFSGEQLRRKLHNCIQDLKGNIRVFCRLRPALTDDEKLNRCNFNFPDISSMEISRSKTTGNVKSNESQEFTFDRAFDEGTTQEEIFEELSQLVQSAMDGYHVCVFAYGQTGSGKTYTMQGEPTPKEHLGMIPRSVKLLFDRKEEMHKMGWDYKIQASFLEIYNENIRDLLNMNSGKSLDIRYNEGRGTSVPNLTVISISSAAELVEYMYKAQQNRSTAVTNFNEHSSRSHAVTKIYIEASHKDSKDVYVGSVSLVDLAGSESAKSVSNERLVETKNINKSLSNLGNVLMALHKKDTHIPYRNSKLTFLLQSSLGGNCKCLMIVNISPVNDSYNESINALRFAAKVKEVKIASTKNKLTTPCK